MFKNLRNQPSGRKDLGNIIKAPEQENDGEIILKPEQPYGHRTLFISNAHNNQKQGVQHPTH
ncbi:hypothetical protein ACTXT7_001447 [Hymenolepis weldensis]